MEPAIRHAERGFPVSPYLATCIAEIAADLALDPAIAAVFLPGGKPLAAGDLLVQRDYAETLRRSRSTGRRAVWRRARPRDRGLCSTRSARSCGSRISRDYRTIEREPVRGTYRGVEIVGPPPPCSGGVHTIQILNMLEAFDVGRLGFGTPETLHLVLEALKIAAADRRAATADPAFVDVPMARLISKDYADAAPRARSTAARRHLHVARAVERIRQHDARHHRRRRRQHRHLDADASTACSARAS